MGKTTTKDVVAHLLSRYRSVFSSPATYNSAIGVPFALLRCPKSIELLLVEVAISEPHLAKTFAHVVKPTSIAVTSLEPRWLDAFGSPDAIDQAVGEFINLSEPGSIVADDVCFRRLGRFLSDDVSGKCLPGKVTVGPIETAGVRLSVPDGTNGLNISTLVLTESVSLAHDIALGIDVAARLLAPSVGLPDLLKELSNYSPTASRLEQWKLPTGQIILRDLATTDPVPLRSGLRAAKLVASSSKAELRGRSGRTHVLLRSPEGELSDKEAADVAQVILSERPTKVLVLGVEYFDKLSIHLGRRFKLETNVFVVKSDSEAKDWIEGNVRPSDAILIQSPRATWMTDLAGGVVTHMAPNRMYLDLDALEYNVREIRRIIGPSVQLAAMVKAMAYGTDPLDISLALERFGVDYLAVSSVDEGKRLRVGGVTNPILVLLSDGSDMERIVQLKLTPVVYSWQMLHDVLSYAQSTASGSRDISIHLEVDTGMHRTGLTPAEASRAFKLIADSSVALVGLMTHLACADDPDEDSFTYRQLSEFDKCVVEARALGFENLTVHAAASAGAIRIPTARYDLVRIGLALLGIYPGRASRPLADLRPVVRLVSRIVEISDVCPGEFVGYGATYTTNAPTRIGVVPAGYHDCVPRSFSNHGSVEVLGVRAGIIGMVSMDSMMIDLSNCPNAVVGTDVTLYGGNVPIEDIAAAADTIPYELLTRVGPRVQRIFTAHGGFSRPQ